jgi:hypothetical protein
MKNRSKLFGVMIAILLLLCGWWLWKSKEEPASENASKFSTANSASDKAVPPSLSPSSYPNGLRPIKNIVDPKVGEIEKVWAFQNAQNQDFYGQVIDQNGQPVVNAQVAGNMAWIQGVDVGEKTKTYTTETDSNGEFQLTGISGWNLGVVPHKAGYEFAIISSTLKLPHGGKTSPSSRAILTMWKLQGAQPIIMARIHAYIPCDGTPTLFDLATGKRVASGGSLTVRLSRDPVDIVRGKPFNWQLTLEIAGGGLQEIADLYPNEAPVDGYQQTITVNMPVGTTNWSPDLQKGYYFITGNRQEFGRINVDLTGDFQPPPTSFDADIWFNSSGSRDLESDPAQAIKP